MNFKRKIDHIVLAVPNLEEGMKDFENLLGVAPKFGGYHTNQGTKNAILNLGNQIYLEIITVDFKNKNISAPRWMGVDLINIPKITRWSLKSENLNRDSIVIKNHNNMMGNIHGGQRKMSNGKLLTWEMILPLAKPEIEVIPFMTDWQNSDVHPTDSMEEICQLLDLTVSHPTPELIQPVFDELDVNLNILKSEITSINIKIKCPNGIIKI